MATTDATTTPTPTPTAAAFARAARFIADADCVLIGTGAGMGVASGIGTFRGRNAGIWPPLERLGLSFPHMSCPDRFREDPAFAWAFWQFRYAGYSAAQPHDGYAILRRLLASRARGGFVYSSNIDGAWQAAGVDDARVFEIHGSVHYSQCQGVVRSCPRRDTLWPTDGEFVRSMKLSDDGERIVSPLPRCAGCDSVQRPAVLMFGDFKSCDEIMDAQSARYHAWLHDVERQYARSTDTASRPRLVVIELGAGVTVNSVRHECETTAARLGAPLIRVNLEHPQLDGYGGGEVHADNYVALQCDALTAMQGIERALAELGVPLPADDVDAAKTKKIDVEHTTQESTERPASSASASSASSASSSSDDANAAKPSAPTIVKVGGAAAAH